MISTDPGTAGKRRMPALPIVWIVVTAFVAAAPALGILDVAWSRQVLLIALLALIVSGLNLSFGYAGELSFAAPAMYAAGAYATGYLALNVVNDLLLALVLSALVGLLLGLISGIPGLRLGGWMLATSSFFLVLLVPDVVVMFGHELGGHQGIAGIPRAKVFGVELDDHGLFVAAILITSVWLALMRNLVESRTGRAFAVLRQSPILASSMGISVYGLKLRAYALSGLPAAMAGTIFAYLDGFIAPESFGISFLIAVLAACILGGRRSIYGVFIGAALLQLGPMRVTIFGDYALIAYGALLVAVGVLLPGGIAGLVDTARRKIAARRRPHSPGRVPGTRSDVVLDPVPGKILVVTGVSKSFGGVAALSDVSIQANPGEVLALIGPNGSGKTTLLNVISGIYRPNAGKLFLEEKDITGLSAAQVARLGVMRTFQTPIVPTMTVASAVEVPRFANDRVGIIETMLRLPRYRSAVRRDESSSRRVLELTGLLDLASASASSLPLGTRRVLELARTLVVDPSVVLLDEIASGLDEGEIESLAEVVRRLRDAGATIILVEHNFSLVRALADRVIVLSRGEVVAEGTPDEIARHPEVLVHYLGEQVQPSTVAAVIEGPEIDEGTSDD